MRLSITACLLAVAAVQKAVARPTPEAILEALARRQVEAENGEEIDPMEPDVPELEEADEINNRMIGDLRQGATTPVGESIRNILLRTESAEGSNSRYTPPGGVNSAKCKADTCMWKPTLSDHCSH